MGEAQARNAQVLAAAARLAFAGSPPKQRVANHLILALRNAGHAVAISLQSAATVAQMPPSAVLPLLQADKCFKILPSTAAERSDANCFVALDAAVLLRKGREHTSTGVIEEELPQPTGYVDGKHPKRPGRPDCHYFVTFGHCQYNQKCVFNHPGKSYPRRRGKPTLMVQPQLLMPLMAAALGKASGPPPPPPRKAQQQQQPKPQILAAPNPANSTSNSNGAGNMPLNTAASTWQRAATAAVLPDAVSAQSQDVCKATAAAGAAAMAATAASKLAPQLQQPQAVPRNPARPGARPCPQYLLRGMCPAGSHCPFDHPQPSGAVGGSLSATAAPAQATIMTAASAADAGPPGYAAAPPGYGATTVPVVIPAAPAAADTQQPAAPVAVAAPPVPPGALQLPPAATAATAARQTWAATVRGPVKETEAAGKQQVAAGGPMEQSLQVLGSGQGQPPIAAADGAGNNKPAQLLGWTAGNLPQLCGRPNCPFYMGTGSCSFKESCIYHHPPKASHPECVLTGETPRTYPVHAPAPYGRLVSITERLWDYDSCVEAQLKIWLAKHLISKENPECRMFDMSASQAAADYKRRGKVQYYRPLGPYSCALGDAGSVLHSLWKAQPDASAKETMPYSKRIRELLQGDTYFEVAVDKFKESHYWVRLRVEKLKQMLNF